MNDTPETFALTPIGRIESDYPDKFGIPASRGSPTPPGPAWC